MLLPATLCPEFAAYNAWQCCAGCDGCQTKCHGGSGAAHQNDPGQSSSDEKPPIVDAACQSYCKVRICSCVPRRWRAGSGSCFVSNPEPFNPAPLPAAARQGALSGMQADLVQDAGPLSSNKSDLASVFPAPRLPSGDGGDTSGVAASRAASVPGDGG